jgi:hypothetical protein
MARPRSAFFTARVAAVAGAAVIAVAIPLLGSTATSGADPTPPPPSTTATTNGHDWMG